MLDILFALSREVVTDHLQLVMFILKFRKAKIRHSIPQSH